MTTDRVSTMQAIVQDGYGAPERVLRPGHIDRPQVGTDDVLVRVRATSVNTPDWATVAGVPCILRLRSGLRRPSQPVRGGDVAGVVEAVGRDVTDLRPGDEVLGSLWGSRIGSQAGTFAHYTIAPASQLVTKPAGLSFEEAAASVMTGLTEDVYLTVTRLPDLRTSNTVVRTRSFTWCVSPGICSPRGRMASTLLNVTVAAPPS